MVEWIIVVAIIGLLIAIAIPNLRQLRAESEQKRNPLRTQFTTEGNWTYITFPNTPSITTSRDGITSIMKAINDFEKENLDKDIISFQIIASSANLIYEVILHHKPKPK